MMADTTRRNILSGMGMLSLGLVLSASLKSETQASPEIMIPNIIPYSPEAWERHVRSMYHKDTFEYALNIMIPEQYPGLFKQFCDKPYVSWDNQILLVNKPLSTKVIPDVDGVDINFDIYHQHTLRALLKILSKKIGMELMRFHYYPVQGPPTNIENYKFTPYILAIPHRFIDPNTSKPGLDFNYKYCYHI